MNKENQIKYRMVSYFTNIQHMEETVEVLY